MKTIIVLLMLTVSVSLAGEELKPQPVPRGKVYASGTVTSILRHNGNRFTVAIGNKSFDCRSRNTANVGDLVEIRKPDGEDFAVVVVDRAVARNP